VPAKLVAKATFKPPAGAALPRVTVPVELVPPTTDDGFNERETDGAVIVSVALADWPPADAPMLLVALAPTIIVVTVNVAVVAPAGTVTVAGTCASVALLEVRATDIPPVGAALPRVTVPVELMPPATDVGFRERPVTTGGLTVKVAVSFVAPVVAVIVAVVAVATATVVAVNVAAVAPAATVTDAGTVVEAELDPSVTAIPPVGAGPLIVTVPVDDVRPVTVVGFIAKALIFGA